MDRLETLIGNENAADTAVSSVGAALDISARFQAVDQPADRNLPDIQLPRKVHLHHTFIASTREPRQNRPLRYGDNQRFHDLVKQGAQQIGRASSREGVVNNVEISVVV